MKVLAFEQLRNDIQGFANAITEYAGANPATNLRREAHNRGMCGLTLALKRQVNRFAVYDSINPGAFIQSVRPDRALVRGFERLDRFVPEPVNRASNARLRDCIRQRVGDRFRESNRRLAEIAGLPLRDLGYDMPAHDAPTA